MKKNIPVLLVTILLISITLSYSSSFGAILFYEGWEDGIRIDGNVGLRINSHSPNHCCDHSLTTGKQTTGFPVGKGSYSLRCLVIEGDPPVKNHKARAALTGRNAENTEGVRLDAWKKDRWYGISVFIPEESGYTYREHGIIQFHNYQTGYGVPLYLFIDGGPKHPWHKEPTWMATRHNPEYDQIFRIDATEDIGKWTHWVFQINWDDRAKDSGNQGIMRIWKNSTLVYEEDPFVYKNPVHNIDTYAPYVVVNSDVATTVVQYPIKQYFDSYVVGDENSSLSEILSAMKR